MKARFVHRCTHVLDKEASIKFYEEALGFKVVREMGTLRTDHGPILLWQTKRLLLKLSSLGTAARLSHMIMEEGHPYCLCRRRLRRHP